MDTRRVPRLLLYAALVLIVVGGTPHAADAARNTLLGGPPVLFVTVESTRADHIGPCYGYHRDTAPALCDLAEDGVLFEQAYSQGSLTAMAAPALVTGKNPATVGLSDIGQVIPENVTTVGDRMQAAGYHIGGQGRTAVLHPSDNPVARRTGELQYPWFYWQFVDPAHGPYLPPQAFRRWDTVSNETFQRLQNPEEGPDSLWQWWKRNAYDVVGVENVVALYDEEILEADARIAEPISQLKRRGTYEDTLIVVTSDHGERVHTPDNPGHVGGRPDERTTHVPLIIKFPDNRYAGTRVSRPVRHIDVAPTIYDVAGIDAATDGASLLPLIQGGEEGNRTVYAAANPWRYWWIRDGASSYSIANPEEACSSLTTLQNTVPATNGTEMRLHHELCTLYRQGHADRPAFHRPNLTDAMRDRLTRLGYLQ